MPEYHQIQTYINVDSNLSKVKTQCAHFFDVIGCLTPDVQEWLKHFRWDISENGFVYGRPEWPSITCQKLDIKVSFLGWTPQILSSLMTNCLELHLSIETSKVDDLSSFPDIRYKPYARQSVWHIMQVATQHFHDYGVFFTDEAQDGNALEGLIDTDHEKLWQFEIGIISPRWKPAYNPERPDYFVKHNQDELWLARKFVFDDPPWSS